MSAKFWAGAAVQRVDVSTWSKCDNTRMSDIAEFSPPLQAISESASREKVTRDAFENNKPS
jgi:hypothetical protein